MCFVDAPMERSEFPEIVDMVEKELSADELETYLTIERMDIDSVYTNWSMYVVLSYFKQIISR